MKVLTSEERKIRIVLFVTDLINSLVHKNFILNLGVGIPTMVSSYLDNDRVFIHTENGMLGVGPLAAPEEEHPDLRNAGRQPVKETPGCSYFDNVDSFGLVRGGHIDATVIGAFEVDSDGHVANWIIPGGEKVGVGGAMDLLEGTKTAIIAMTHESKVGPKLVKKCSYPITSLRKVNFVVTEYGVFQFKNDRFVLEVIANDISVEELTSITELEFDVSAEIGIRSF